MAEQSLGGKAKFTKSSQGQEIEHRHDSHRPEGTRHLKEHYIY